MLVGACNDLDLVPGGRDEDGLPSLVRVFNVFGTLDPVVAITLATVYEASIHMGAAYWIPAFWVPAFFVTHCLTFVVLRSYRDRATSLYR